MWIELTEMGFLTFDQRLFAKKNRFYPIRLWLHNGLNHRNKKHNNPPLWGLSLPDTPDIPALQFMCQVEPSLEIHADKQGKSPEKIDPLLP